MRHQRNIAHTTLQGVKLGSFNFSQYAPDALKGLWLRKWEEYLHLTVAKGHAILSSDVMTEPTSISMELPAHAAFWINILGPSGCRTVLIDKDSPVSITLDTNEQIQAIFKLGDNNGL